MEQQEKRVKMFLLSFSTTTAAWIKKEISEYRVPPADWCRGEKKESFLSTDSVCDAYVASCMRYSQWFCFLSFHVVTFTKKRGLNSIAASAFDVTCVSDDDDVSRQKSFQIVFYSTELKYWVKLLELLYIPCVCLAIGK